MPTPSRRQSHPLGTILLALALAAAGCSWPSPTTEGDRCTETKIRGVSAGGIVVDGVPDEWAGATPQLQHSPTKASGYRLKAFYLAADKDKLYLRIDAELQSLPSEAGVPLDAGGGSNSSDLRVTLKTTQFRSGDLTFQPPSMGPCGGEGMRCCNGNACLAGSVCDTGTGKCVHCSIDEKCCAGRTCASGACTGPGDGTCTHCGATGEACCSGNACSGGNICSGGSGGTCVHCGAAGEPCCALNTCDGGGCCVFGGSCGGNNGCCTSSGAACPGIGGTCKDGSCGTCGARDQSCCAPSSSCTAPSTSCAGGSCVGCGGSNQPCCQGSFGPQCGPSLQCNSQACIPCGGAGQPCCNTSGPSGSCESPLTCGGNNTCTSGGAQACCSGSSCNFNGADEWTCNSQWHTNDSSSSQPTIAGEAKGRYSGSGVVIEASISAKDFGNLISLYPTSERRNDCSTPGCTNGRPPTIEDEMGCVWARWPP